MIGVGKTTLAKAIYYHKAAVEHFPIRVWVTVTEGAAYKAQVLLMKKDGTKDQTLYVTQVRDHLKEKLCLVVLDNVSNTKDFDKLYEILSGSGMINGSRIVLTTRFKNVALHADTSNTPHQIRLLTKEESWELFKKVTGTEKTKLESKVEKLARNVVGRCGGLPLAISSIGCVLQAKGMSQENLLWVLERINHGNYKAQWLQAWKKNKQELSETMSNCLYYFILFPIDFEIPARRLVNLWVAEGLVKQNNQKTAEDIAEKCLEDLRDCNMIQVVALKSNAKIKTCHLPSMLREIILQDSNRTRHHQYSGIPLSVFFFDKREGSKPGEHVEKILSKGIASEQFRDIRVLDLERIFRPQLPRTLCKLIHITYLSLRWTYLEEFPPFIGKLLNLETLDLKHTCIRVLPSSIWKLKKLRNLYLNQKYRSRLEGKLRGNYQENLQTLWGVFMYGDCPLLQDLHKLKNLKNLKLAFQLTETEKETLAKKIAQLNQLHSLRLRSVNEIGSPKKLILYDMSKLENLSSLQLFGKLKDKLHLNSFPKNLTDLTLSESKLSDDPMPKLQSLFKLKSLCFYADSYKGRSMVCITDSFPQLQVLRFWNLRELQEWDVKEGAMPSLVEFEARSCRNLEFPTGLKHLKTLCLIKLYKMSEQFMNILNHKKTLSDDVEIHC
uniref:Disease resistance RPP8-like protein 2 n=1 Tax=Cajanus cajan TaxID=3821 RepID=A0A151S6V2_CAJCA|nr:putative disease resistance RPP8-like protein 2 [Cajanus cajan]